ncbi:hypothetical protein SH449x_002958 [Pirellulaceae bacterium SH449]
MISYFQDNSRVTPISRGVILSTKFRGSLRVGELIGGASHGASHCFGASTT